jgi:hypothetical protein
MFKIEKNLLPEYHQLRSSLSDYFCPGTGKILSYRTPLVSRALTPRQQNSIQTVTVSLTHFDCLSACFFQSELYTLWLGHSHHRPIGLYSHDCLYNFFKAEPMFAVPSIQSMTTYAHSPDQPCVAGTTEYTEWQWPLSGLHSIIMVKSGDEGCTLSPFHSIYHHEQSCCVRSS